MTFLVSSQVLHPLCRKKATTRKGNAGRARRRWPSRPAALSKIVARLRCAASVSSARQRAVRHHDRQEMVRMCKLSRMVLPLFRGVCVGRRRSGWRARGGPDARKTLGRTTTTTSRSIRGGKPPWRFEGAERSGGHTVSRQERLVIASIAQCRWAGLW